MKYEKGFDVIICGGGTSGAAAAISSARAGAKTLLIERLGALGGQMNVSGPPGFSYAWLFNQRGEQIIAGIVEETHNRLLKEGHALPHNHSKYREGSGYTFSYVDPDWWGLLIFNMMEENGVTLLLHSLVVDVIKEENKVTGVVVENANGRVEIMGKIVIDCTGEGYIASRAGAPWEMVPREEIQPHTLAFTCDGIDWDEFLAYVRANPREFYGVENVIGRTKDEMYEILSKANNIIDLGEMRGFFSILKNVLAKGEWPETTGMGFFIMPKGDDQNRKILAHFQHSSQVAGRSPDDAWDLTYCEVECRKQIQMAFKCFKKYVPGFQNMYITRICPELRIREGRRIMGDYYLTSEDVGDAKKFPDVIGKSGFAAGGHHVATTDTITTDIRYRPKDGGSHDIPYRCLVPKKVENLLIAGKAISTDRDAYHRFLQQTMVTGQAAGVAAALCAKYSISPRNLEKDVSELQKILLEQGAILYGTY
ncbi:MAG: FAD-dependent oxidoreductase [Atribacterota bacterium]|nr:FAD-dependent oxidoreductase [Atribacterota bacterium]MDD4896054.1 FAD-dependent oxidoreductase [Atribacterota bacterium]MDD5637129.1 FAD-dependent oxidoreductase [Atribacterota bacterium]